MEKENIVKDGILHSSDDDKYTPETPQGSIYKAVLSCVHKHLEEHGDWVVLKNCITNETFLASQFEPLAKK